MKKSDLRFVLRNGIVQHEGDLPSCEAYIRNSMSLFDVQGQSICRWDSQSRKYVPL